MWVKGRTILTLHVKSAPLSHSLIAAFVGIAFHSGQRIIVLEKIVGVVEEKLDVKKTDGIPLAFPPQCP